MNQEIQVLQEKPVNELRERVAKIPTARLVNIDMGWQGIENPKGILGVVIDDKLAATVSDRYCLVQHRDAFKPIIDGLEGANIPFKYTVWDGKMSTKAYMDLLTTDTIDSVQFGFRAISSVDGKNAIRYSFSSFKYQHVVELVGYRQTCSNGMKIRVPLMNAEFVRFEERDIVKKLLETHARIVHVKDADKKVKLVELAVEAMTVLKEPIARMITAAQNKPIAEKYAKQMIANYIGTKMGEAILEQYRQEQQNLWGLYNACTYIASHAQIADRTGQSLINKSAVMLERELSPQTLTLEPVGGV